MTEKSGLTLPTFCVEEHPSRNEEGRCWVSIFDQIMFFGGVGVNSGVNSLVDFLIISLLEF